MRSTATSVHENAESKDPTATGREGGHVDVPGLAQVIDTALAAAGLRPSREELADLEHRLRHHIAAMCPVVQAVVDRLNRGGPHWYLAQATLDTARWALSEGRGDDLMSAQCRVTRLARSCRALLNGWQRWS
ncbi:DUF6415 family natural product biosynthesis protein [Streptomyces sp. URMC 123]|uniref:DUF6415 family natural product biosynthesis protein n=1 Tax=Streptomyces sp. URMC 123 TaxID=3423403 RepID=UPI003F1CEB59